MMKKRNQTRYENDGAFKTVCALTEYIIDAE